MSRLLYLISFIVAIFVFAVLVDQIAVLKQLDSYLRENPQPWIGLALGAVLLGMGLLLFAWVGWGSQRNRPMTEKEAKEYMKPNPRFIQRSAFRGKAAGVTTPQGAASFQEIKGAALTGRWLQDPQVRVFCAGTAGLLLALLGAFGYFIVVGSPTVKVICAGVLLYAYGRTAWAFWNA